jgi:hypothetical protein
MLLFDLYVLARYQFECNELLAILVANNQGFLPDLKVAHGMTQMLLCLIEC